MHYFSSGITWTVLTSKLLDKRKQLSSRLELAILPELRLSHTEGLAGLVGLLVGE